MTLSNLEAQSSSLYDPFQLLPCIFSALGERSGLWPSRQNLFSGSFTI